MADEFERLRRSLADRYRLERELGRGGMATVYLAQDLKHDRPVAFKVLRPDLAAVLGTERFLREIRLAAQLTHPHILPLYDSGEAEGLVYYVMPYVAGESLRNRLDREIHLPIGQAVEIARHVATALAYAHSLNVVHRDIKPENILLEAGQAVVADFGIARAITAAAGEQLTQSGIAVGTPAYMSPEQASGERKLDGRCDVYSLGCVLYEMLAGEPPFTGPDPQAITARKLAEQVPDLRLVRETVPRTVEAAIRKSLAKVPADRFATAQEFADSLVVSDVASISSSGTTVARYRYARRLALIVASIFGVLGVGAAGATFWKWLRPDSPTRGLATRFSVVPTSGVHFMPEQGTPTVALSPDGTHLVYLARDSTGVRLYLRASDRLEAHPIPGTEDAVMPFFSPDGMWVGFVRAGELKKVAVAGGPAVTIAKVGRPRGASWSPSGHIVFAPGTRSGLLRVSASGGDPEVLTEPKAGQGALDHRWVEILPGEKAALFTVWTGNAEDARIAVAALQTGVVKTLVAGVYARYAPTGHLVYARPDGTLLAVPFDVAALEITGPSVPILEGVVVKLTGAAEFTLSASGSLAYLAGAPVKHTLVLVDRRGDVRVLVEGPPSPRTPRFSPDGRRVAVTLRESFEARDIWLYQMEHGPLSRLTFEGGDDPTWTPDGSRVTFRSWSRRSSDRAAAGNLFWIPSDLSGSHEQLLTSGQLERTGSWSPDGQFLVFVRSDPTTLSDLWVLHTDGERRARPFLQTAFSEGAPALSPNGRWLAYESNESGRYEVYVCAFPTPGRKWQVSVGGGLEPRWASNGRKLFYWGKGGLVTAAISTDREFGVQRRRVVFDKAWLSSYRDYDVHPDGERLLMAKVEAGEDTTRLIVVQHWTNELRQRFEH